MALTSCGNNKKKSMADKIAIEMQHLDEKVTKFMETFSELGKRTVDEFQATVKSEGNNQEGEKSENDQSSDGGSSNSDSENSKSTDENSENNNEQINVMKSEYIINDETTENQWKQMNKETLNLETSWTAIQNDLTDNDGISYELLMNISNNIENLYVYSNDKDKMKFIEEVLNMYSNIIKISTEIGLDNNKLYLMKIKYEIYQAYYYVINNDWEMSRNKIAQAKEYLKDMNNIKESDKLLIETMEDCVNNQDEEKFLVKYNFVMKNLQVKFLQELTLNCI